MGWSDKGREIEDGGMREMKECVNSDEGNKGNYNGEIIGGLMRWNKIFVCEGDLY
jgi:hypothetical protein